MERAVDFIYEIPKFTTKNSLDHTRQLMGLLGDPGRGRRVIHVAGSNGKGSVCCFLYSMLLAAGKSAALFTSPHLTDIRERFQVNGELVSEQVFFEAFVEVKDASAKLVQKTGRHPTFFEFLFAMGMVIYEKADVEYIVLETGLGGRLDATNSFPSPLLTLITSISLEHTEYLGDTIREIAGEKAGIIVPGVPVIYDGNNEKAAAVIRERAKALHSPFYEVCRQDTEILKNTREGIDFVMKDPYYKDTVFSIPFIARYQVMNGALALKTMEVLKNTLPVSLEEIKEGMKKTRWQGRMETVLPGVIVDGAHNEDGVETFVETAAHFQENYPLTLLFSAVEDKDYRDMIRTICQRISFAHVVTTQVGGERMVPAEKLAGIFKEMGCPDVQWFSQIPEAFKAACSVREEEGMLFCVGSLYLVGAVKDVIRKSA